MLLRVVGGVTCHDGNVLVTAFSPFFLSIVYVRPFSVARPDTIRQLHRGESLNHLVLHRFFLGPLRRQRALSFHISIIRLSRHLFFISDENEVHVGANRR